MNWSEEISEIRQMFNKYYDKAIEDDDYDIAEIIYNIMNEFEDIDDRYCMER